MANGTVALESLQHLWSGEGIADQAAMPLGIKLAAVIGNNASRFLPAMLQCMQAERGQRGGVTRAEYAEDATFLMQLVIVARKRMHRKTGIAFCHVSIALAHSGVSPIW